jgi:hypothetical protein
MDYETYLIEKKIDPEAFRDNEPDKWQSFKVIFESVHPNSFTVQKKFLLNDLRRLYNYKSAEPVKPPVESKEETVSTEVKKPARAVVRRAPVIKKPDENVSGT